MNRWSNPGSSMNMSACTSMVKGARACAAPMLSLAVSNSGVRDSMMVTRVMGDPSRSRPRTACSTWSRDPSVHASSTTMISAVFPVAAPMRVITSAMWPAALCTGTTYDTVGESSRRRW